MMSIPKYIVILTGLFFKRSGRWYFALLLVFSHKYFGKGWFFGMTTLALGLASQAQANKTTLWYKLEKRQQNKTNCERKKVKEEQKKKKKKKEELHIVFSLLTEEIDELSFERQCKVLTT